MDVQIQPMNNNEIPQQVVSTLRKRFTEKEDNLLKHVIQELHIRNWSEVARYLPGRTARQCRDRYNSYLFKEISNKPWTDEEDAIILRQYPIYGTHWVKISKFLVGRSGNNVKNRWYKYLSKRYSDYISKHDYFMIPNQQQQQQKKQQQQQQQRKQFQPKPKIQPPQQNPQTQNVQPNQFECPVTITNCIKDNPDPDINSQIYLNFFGNSLEWELFPSNNELADSSYCFF